MISTDQKLVYGHHSQLWWGQWGDAMAEVGHRYQNSDPHGRQQMVVRAELT